MLVKWLQNTDIIIMIMMMMVCWWGTLYWTLYRSLKLVSSLFYGPNPYFMSRATVAYYRLIHLMSWSEVSVLLFREILSPPSISPVELSDWCSSGSGSASAGRGSSLTRFTSLWSSSASCGTAKNTMAQLWTPVRIPVLFHGGRAPSHQFLEIIISPDMDAVEEDLRDCTSSC